MPFKCRDAWHRQMRAYLEARRNEVARTTLADYRGWLEDAGCLVGFQSPTRLPLAQMQRIEAETFGCSSTKLVHCAIVRNFLLWCGNVEAKRWKIISKQRPKVDGVFLNEPQVRTCRDAARSLGTEAELMFSLGVDNGMRLIDMKRLTLENAHQLLSSGVSMILSKGRGGGKLRPQALNDVTRNALLKYLEQRKRLVERYGERRELLIHEFRKAVQPMSSRYMRKRLTAVSGKARVRFKPHDLRRTFGHRHWKAGTPLETIAALMGHESINQTFKCYIGIIGDDLVSAQRNLCPSDPTHA